MNLSLDLSLAEGYKSNSQIARVLTERWVEQNVYCIRCGNDYISSLKNNKPVADFICPSCQNIYELKSKSGRIGNKINDGAYGTMIERIRSDTNPDFLFLTYDKDKYYVNDVMSVPKYFFVPSIIEKRKPLAATARRAGWVGCNILLNTVPKEGRIDIVRNQIELNKGEVLDKLKRTSFMADSKMESRGWIFDILQCIDRIKRDDFTLDDMYEFEDELKTRHPENYHIRDKIRQQLQFIRDRGLIKFVARGHYRKV
jgi:type II restriction enzyme